MPSTHLSFHVHLIFSTKDREPWLVPGIREETHRMLGGCLKTVGAFPQEIGGVSDHVHLLLGLPATLTIADVVREIKKATSHWLKTEKKIPEFAWQDGYGAFTVSPSHRERIRAYIQNQEDHHRKKTFQEEYVEFLEKTGTPYKPEFLW